MPRILYLTTELPYFPGQGGLMALQLGQLAREHQVGVVGPRYPRQPEGPLQHLRDTVNKSHWWPEHPEPGSLPVLPAATFQWGNLFRILPRSLQLRLLRRLTGLHRYSEDAFAWRVVLVRIAPKILEALDQER